jgi:hypothetical protein
MSLQVEYGSDLKQINICLIHCQVSYPLESGLTLHETHKGTSANTVDGTKAEEEQRRTKTKVGLEWSFPLFLFFSIFLVPMQSFIYSLIIYFSFFHSSFLPSPYSYPQVMS